MMIAHEKIIRSPPRPSSPFLKVECCFLLMIILLSIFLGRNQSDLVLIHKVSVSCCRWTYYLHLLICFPSGELKMDRGVVATVSCLIRGSLRTTSLNASPTGILTRGLLIDGT